MNVGILVQQNLCERVRRGLCKRHWLSRITKPNWEEHVFLDLIRGKREIEESHLRFGEAHGEGLKDGEGKDGERKDEQKAGKVQTQKRQKSSSLNLLLLELNRTGRAAFLRSLEEKDSVSVVQKVERLIEVDLGSSICDSEAKVAKDAMAGGVEVGDANEVVIEEDSEPAIVCRLVEFGGKHQHRVQTSSPPLLNANHTTVGIAGTDGDALHSVSADATGPTTTTTSTSTQCPITTNRPPSNPPLSKSNFTFVDLFAGIGGFASGLGSGKFHNLQGDCLVASEIDSEARLLYEMNHGMPRWGFNVDIYNLDVEGLIGRELREFNGCKSELRVFDHDLETRFVPRQTDYGPSQLTATKTTDASHSTNVSDKFNATLTGSYSKESESRSDPQSDSKSQQKRTGEIDILCAGFPCQSFTKANSDARGLDCEKNGPFFFEILRLLGGKRNPEIVDRGSGSRTSGGVSGSRSIVHGAGSSSGRIGSSAAASTHTSSGSAAGSSSVTSVTQRSSISRCNNLNHLPHVPKALILENVPNLIDLDNGETFQIIQEHLEACDYEVFHKIISTQEAGLPQNRERLYIVAFLRSYGGESESLTSKIDGNFNFSWPDFKQNESSLNDKQSSGKDGAKVSKDSERSKSPSSLTVRDILEPDSPALWNGPHRLTPHQWEKVRNHRSYKTSLKRRLVDVDDVSRTLGSSYRRGFLIQSEFVPVPVPGESKNQMSMVGKASDANFKAANANESQNESEPEVGNAKRRKLSDSAVGIAQVSEAPEQKETNDNGNEIEIGDNAINEIDDTEIEIGDASATNKSSSSSSTPIPSPPRFFTPRECARLQGFPEDFIIEGKRNPNRWYHQCGNSVSPVVVSAIAARVVEVLMRRESETVRTNK